MVTVEFPATEFVPDYEVVEFDAAEGFTSKSGSGAIRWLAARTYDMPPNTDDYEPAPLAPFHPDGSPMSGSEVSAMGPTKRDLEAWGWEVNGELGTAMTGFLDLQGFENLQCDFRDVFDAATHVSLRQLASARPQNGGLSVGMSLPILHDAPLLGVIDLAHGATRDFTIPLAKGATVSDTGFRLEIIDAFEGSVYSAGSSPVRSGKATEMEYNAPSSSDTKKTFSIVYQINPPSMTNAVSVDAIDAAGNIIENRGRFMEFAAPISRFHAPLATATSLRVRYRPHQTRLLLKLKALPGVTAPNLAPANLFDVRAPRITIRDSFQMRRIISSGSQLKDITGFWSYDTPAAFPMTLTNVSPREVAQRYLALDQGRRISIKPGAMTIEFEPAKKTSWIDKTIGWFKGLCGRP
jgi:hypothetical protein